VWKRWFKVPVFLLCLLPAGLLVRGMLSGDLGVNPAETIQLQTGRWALKLLLISLAITPLRRLTHWNIVIQYRRMVGLFAFFYASTHFLAYWAFDLNFAFAAMVGDVLKRPFITMGFAAFLLLIPLALTSTKGSIRRLGKKWTQLHRLVYIAAISAVIHFAWKVKVFTGEPVFYAAILMVLLGFRLTWLLRGRAASSARAARTTTL
jgi:methionine sulfoxide reductase heme-binding subunit